MILRVMHTYMITDYPGNITTLLKEKVAEGAQTGLLAWPGLVNDGIFNLL